MTDLLGEPDLTTLTPGPIDEAAIGVGVALLVRVRAGRNKTFDRLVFDFEGPAPGIRVEYVDQLVQDATGEPIRLRGRAVVQIVIRPANAHRDDGTPTITGPLPDLTGFAAFRQIADAGDFEAVLTWGIGVAARTGLRAFTLTGPSRVAVDEQFGPITEQATRDFQRDNRLAVDGIVGPNTRAAMVRVLDL
jgi:peptidoglycan hydrolase-like protein with peptidoglycan-binding domain